MCPYLIWEKWPFKVLGFAESVEVLKTFFLDFIQPQSYHNPSSSKLWLTVNTFDFEPFIFWGFWSNKVKKLKILVSKFLRFHWSVLFVAYCKYYFVLTVVLSNLKVKENDLVSPRSQHHSRSKRDRIEVKLRSFECWRVSDLKGFDFLCFHPRPWLSLHPNPTKHSMYSTKYWYNRVAINYR